jgi:YidC/Oxa1 family membrane protein insertase
MNFMYNMVIYPLVQIIEFVFVFTQKIFKETGLSLTAVSVAVSVLCLPLYNVAEKWQSLERDLQKKLKPGMDKIKAVFAGDERYMILSTYYRQNHYHPVFAMRSSLGLLIQIPFFIAAYSYLSHFEALNGAHFWIFNDLGRPDALLHLGGMGINVLPVLMTVINVVSGAIYTKGLPAREKIQLYGMAVIFLVLLYNSPAGLVFYWTLNNIFSLVKNCYYAVKFRFKHIVLYVFVSLLFVLFGFYMIFVSRGNFDLRATIALLTFVIAFTPWLFSFVKKFFVNREFISIPQKAATGIFAASCLCIWALLGLVTPSLLISASPNEFAFIDTYKSPLFFLFNTASQTLGFFIFWPLCLYAFFSEKIKKLFSLMFMAVAVMSAVNVFLFPGSYGFVSVLLQFSDNVGHNTQAIALNLLVLLLGAAPFLFLFFKRLTGIIIPVLLIFFASFCTLSLVNIIKIEQSYSKMADFYDVENMTAAEAAPIFHLSKTGKNVVVIMLDKAASVFVPYILEEDPALNDKYGGFVFYPNAVSFAPYTNYGAPPIFGGYDSMPQAVNERKNATLRQKHNEALSMLPVIFSNSGYSVTVTDAPYVNFVYPSDMSFYDAFPNTRGYITHGVYTDLWLKEHDFSFPSTSDTLKRNIFWYSLLRASPYVLRRGIYLNGSWCSPSPDSFLIGTLDGYAVLDYLPRLTDFDSGTENTALVLINNATHEPSFLQAPDYRPVPFVTDFGKGAFRNSSDYHINIASLKRLSEWFDFLRENGAYDNTRIIIVSDHGPHETFVTKTDLPFDVDQFNPVLMVKDFNTSGSLQVNNAFMSNADVPTLALRDVLDDPRNPYTGNPINMDAKQQPLYIVISGAHGHDHLVYAEETQISLDPKKDYYVHDNIFDPANWEKAE